VVHGVEVDTGPILLTFADFDAIWCGVVMSGLAADLTDPPPGLAAVLGVAPWLWSCSFYQKVLCAG